MPQTPTPRRASKHGDTFTDLPPPKSVDLGKPLGVYDTNTVRDRVRQWQAQGGGVITAPECYTEDDEVQSTGGKSGRQKTSQANTPRTPAVSSKVAVDEANSSQKSKARNGRQRERSGEPDKERHRSKSAPARRVVSDAHWRKDRNPSKDASSPKTPQASEAGKTQSEMDDGIRVRPISNSKEGRLLERRENRRKSRRDIERAGSNTNPEAHQDLDKRPPSPIENSKDLSAGKDSRSPASRGSPRSGAHGKRPPKAVSSLQRSPSYADQAKRRSSGPQGDTWSEQDTIPARDTMSPSTTSKKVTKGKTLEHAGSESKTGFAKPQTTLFGNPRVPSVEAWLNDTPDPFVDGESALAEDTENLNESAGHNTSRAEPLSMDDPNKIWDTLDTKDRARSGVRVSRRRRRIPSSAVYQDNPFPPNFASGSPSHTSPAGSTSASKLIDLVDNTSEVPKSLTRRGARKSISSPRGEAKSVPVQDITYKCDEASTATGSSIEPPDAVSPFRPPGATRRPFPSTGKHRLSTIASVDTFNSKLQTSEAFSALDVPSTEVQVDSLDAETMEAESRDQFGPKSLTRSQSRLTKHADLMSVLSMPEPSSKSIRSARSIRTNRSRLATATMGDLMSELAGDEQKYMRELRTLVDGVIPVLLSCVLSKADSAVAAGLFRPSCHGQEDANFTKPIVDMGIALERLKTLHRRIPMQDVRSLLTWAQGAQRVYTEYLKAWRMGFQDVVVNLAPAAEDQKVHRDGTSPNRDGLDGGLPINKDGDVTNGDGERVDVAFLLKRPLVRLKYLAKTLKGINVVSPSAEAESLATKYQNLVTMARNRSNEERARLEDEAAANIDATRARDPRTLAPVSGVSIDRTRRVRARDHFNLALQHSSAQRIDCRVELLLRDESSEGAGSGDLLVCEVDSTGRWLLFPPVQLGRVSARTGQLQGEIVVMVRGLSGAGVEWHEILLLRSEDEAAGFEWVQMLGLDPIPPSIVRTQSFLSKQQRKRPTAADDSTLAAPTASPTSAAKSRTPSPREIEVPIGEQAAHSTKSWDEAKPREAGSTPLEATSDRMKHKLQRKSYNNSFDSQGRTPHTYVDDVSDLRSLPSQSSEKSRQGEEPLRRPRSFKEALGLTGTSSTSLGLKRTRAQKLSSHYGSPQKPISPKALRSDEGRSKASAQNHEYPSDYRHERSDTDLHENPTKGDSGSAKEHSSRPGYHRSPSSVPSMDLPSIPKIRKDSPPTTPIDEPEEEPHWSTPPEPKLPSTTERDRRHGSPSKVRETSTKASQATSDRSSSPVELKESTTPVFNARTTRRRSSSPLKHEYEPSTASDSSDSDTSTVNRNEVSSVSSSDDEELEDGDVPTPLLPPGVLSPSSKPSRQASLYSLPNGTLKPSESASQAPYKKVPSQPAKASKTIASIFSWSDKGSWDSLHPDECSIVITPGLIEAYEMSAAHSANKPLSSPTPVVDMDAFSELASNVTSQEDVVRSERPLVALELTPLVPLRRGTAIDISIRSPPTANSQITSGNNIMFRSRNPEECEALYALINHARIHNPTYIALQNARGPFDAAGDLDRRASTRTGGSRMGSWFGSWGGSTGYRASSAPTPSIAPSESSIGSMSSAFSALKRFGIGGSGMFNIARSTISSREGSRANSLYTSSDNSSGSGASSPLPPGLQGDPQGSIGLSNTKIRLYFRETQTRWRDMGSARLTIMRPSPPDLSSGTSASGESMTRPSSAHQGINEKRIVVRGKTKGEILLDATLGETCFERVGRQGIAVSVWEDIIGPNGEVGTVGAVGGVGAGRAKVYMIQMKGEAETTYTFSIVGRLRY
ncbi:MAG: hypothetical protein Q9222_000688 [Ikaeria aurantiellina]